MKHAFLIVVHHQFEIPGMMMSLMDDEQCDFFIHIDKKAKDVPYDYLLSCCKKSKICFTDRIKVVWGGYSVIQCMEILLNQALPYCYDYYHFLSGADFPIKKKSEILHFFDEHKGQQFVHFERLAVQDKYVKRLRYHSFFQDTGIPLLQLIDKVNRRTEWLIGIDRLKGCNQQFQYGSNWCSITHDFATWVVQQQSRTEKLFRNTRIGDELFIQTLLVNSPYADQVSKYAFQDDYRSSMRFIDWKRGHPYVFRLGNLEELQTSPYLFARKFDLAVDSDIIHALYHQLK